jgi:hypothetical protein
MKIIGDEMGRACKIHRMIKMFTTFWLKKPEGNRKSMCTDGSLNFKTDLKKEEGECALNLYSS